jgi:hypothetical protein
MKKIKIKSSILLYFWLPTATCGRIWPPPQKKKKKKNKFLKFGTNRVEKKKNLNNLNRKKKICI